jgi:citrate synthase
MLQEIGAVERVPEFLAQVKAGERELAGFGHRIYRSQDPRAKLIKSMVPEVYEVCGDRPLLDVATELERQTLEDDYFVSRGLYPNFDFYAGLVYEAIGFPPAMFPVLFAVARTAGWMAHWAELIRDLEQRLTRPRQIYVGEGERHYAPIAERPEPTMREDAVSTSI